MLFAVSLEESQGLVVRVGVVDSKAELFGIADEKPDVRVLLVGTLVQLPHGLDEEVEENLVLLGMGKCAVQHFRDKERHATAGVVAEEASRHVRQRAFAQSAQAVGIPLYALDMQY